MTREEAYLVIRDVVGDGRPLQVTADMIALAELIQAQRVIIRSLEGQVYRAEASLLKLKRDVANRAWDLA